MYELLRIYIEGELHGIQRNKNGQRAEKPNINKKPTQRIVEWGRWNVLRIITGYRFVWRRVLPIRTMVRVRGTGWPSDKFLPRCTPPESVQDHQRF